MASSRSRASPEAVEAPARALAEVLAAAGVKAGSRLCCAFSGGVDSALLLELLAGLRESLDFSLAAAHVHHGLSPHADAWLAFCAERCARLRVPFCSFHVEVPKADPDGPEAAARRLRHAALAAVDCDWLVFGHHQDDQAETLLYRLLRGTGVPGAAAMAAIEAGEPGRLRPLLGVRRAQILAAARARGLEWVEDESNADPRFARNALRHRALPLLESLAPGAVPALARAADHFREASVLLDRLAEIDEAACGGARLDRNALLALEDARICNLLRLQIRRLGAAAPARVRLLEAVRQMRQAPAEHALHLMLGEAACAVYRGRVWLERVSPQEDCGPLRWQGEALLRWQGRTLRLVEVQGQGLDPVRLNDAAEVVLRTRWPGLRMRLGPGRPRRSFKNLCQEAAVPAWRRERLAVLCVDGEAAWIEDVGIAAEFRCAPGKSGVEPRWGEDGIPASGS